ncbi:universal stress protein PHOS32 [Amborella trichopoda]|uniref:UspA domain-containing protein n=1 Tax=Amborella trichopoda TaxID=13333 RepID=U5DBN1_AMBTC|nr:universal stress protein PHOS32 [Amborella trichopoda]ERN17818.1 hypothetical protein AMTR_s00047p00177090 [Amborella trichopoda]|eukprot:XP_020530492.1 universal stress protein PHOS32 [Amborella trichopoda]
MGRTSVKLPGFCLNRISTHVRVRPPPQDEKPISDSIKTEQVAECLRKRETPEKRNGDFQAQNGDLKAKNGDSKEKTEVGFGRTIMIVVDSSPEAKGALQWALSHSVQSDDTLILLHVLKPSKQGEETKMEMNPKNYELPNSLKNLCLIRKPELKVEVVVLEGREKGATIIAEAKREGVSLLVLGQKKRPIVMWRLLLNWAGTRNNNNRNGGLGVVDYCIQNADCLTVAVRRKGRKVGGYLITTRRQKNFWLLA